MSNIDQKLAKEIESLQNEIDELQNRIYELENETSYQMGEIRDLENRNIALFEENCDLRKLAPLASLAEHLGIADMTKRELELLIQASEQIRWGISL